MKVTISQRYMMRCSVYLIAEPITHVVAQEPVLLEERIAYIEEIRVW